MFCRDVSSILLHKILIGQTKKKKSHVIWECDGKGVCFWSRISPSVLGEITKWMSNSTYFHKDELYRNIFSRSFFLSFLFVFLILFLFLTLLLLQPILLFIIIILEDTLLQQLHRLSWYRWL